jgi:transposase-like protein
MTHRIDSTSVNDIFQSLAEHGFDDMAAAMQVLLNECMKIERQEALRVAPYERSDARHGQANGFKPKHVKTRIGELEPAVPQVRGAKFYPRALERGVRSKKALIFDAPDEPSARRQLDQVVAKYLNRAPKLAAWLKANVPEGLTVLRLPPSHRKRMRTTNALERLNRELKRRTRVATLFPNEASLLRLVSAILIEVSEEWESGKRYVTFSPK